MVTKIVVFGFQTPYIAAVGAAISFPKRFDFWPFPNKTDISAVVRLLAAISRPTAEFRQTACPLRPMRLSSLRQGKVGSDYEELCQILRFSCEILDFPMLRFFGIL